MNYNPSILALQPMRSLCYLTHISLEETTRAWVLSLTLDYGSDYDGDVFAHSFMMYIRFSASCHYGCAFAIGVRMILIGATIINMCSISVGSQGIRLK